MTSADEFIQLYNKIDRTLRDSIGVDSVLGFAQVVDRAAKINPTVSRYSSQLRKWGDLRNAIIHHASYPPEIIAEPTQQTLERFRALADSITNPPKVYPKFKQVPQVYSLQDTLSEALRYMRDNDFSQVLVYDNQRAIELLTTEGIAHWLEAQVSGDIINVGETTIGDVHTYDDPKSIDFLARDSSIDLAQAAFSQAIQSGRPRLFALVITHNGLANETPLGIVTPWDLLGETTG